MNRYLYTAFFLFPFLFHAQESVELTLPVDAGLTVTEKTVFYKLADNIVPIKIRQYGDRTDIVYINLHDDETTSVEATKRVLAEHGGSLIEIENNAARNIRFRIGMSFYTVDPNRIFARQGIKTSLDELGAVSAKAIDEVERLGQRIVQLIPGEAKYVIALHNNTPGLFSAKEYSPGNKRSADTKKIFLNPGQDADDFFLTTDQYLYEKLAGRGFNTILQDNDNCAEDGSLSVYCGKRNIRYINCETEHGKTEKYYEMIKALITAFSHKD